MEDPWIVQGGEPDCTRCECGVGSHTCWRKAVQDLPPMYASRLKPVKIAKEPK